MTGIEDTSPPVSPVAATDGTKTLTNVRPRRRLVRKYALLFIALVGAALIVNSAFDFWFSYKENKLR